MEIICPHCLYSRLIPETRIPKSASQATCPKCGTHFQFRDFHKKEKSVVTAGEHNPVGNYSLPKSPIGSLYSDSGPRQTKTSVQENKQEISGGEAETSSLPPLVLDTPVTVDQTYFTPQKNAGSDLPPNLPVLEDEYTGPEGSGMSLSPKTLEQTRNTPVYNADFPAPIYAPEAAEPLSSSLPHTPPDETDLPQGIPDTQKGTEDISWVAAQDDIPKNSFTQREVFEQPAPYPDTTKDSSLSLEQHKEAERSYSYPSVSHMPSVSSKASLAQDQKTQELSWPEQISMPAPAHPAPLTMEQDTAPQASSSTDTSGHDDLAFIANPDAFGEDPAYPQAVQAGPEQATVTPQVEQVQLNNAYRPMQDTAPQASSSTDTSGHDDLAFIANPDAFGEDPAYPQAVQAGPEQATATPQVEQVQLNNAYRPMQDTAPQASSSTDTSGHDDLAFIANPDAFGEDPAYPQAVQAGPEQATATPQVEQVQLNNAYRPMQDTAPQASSSTDTSGHDDLAFIANPDAFGEDTQPGPTAGNRSPKRQIQHVKNINLNNSQLVPEPQPVLKKEYPAPILFTAADEQENEPGPARQNNSEKTKDASNSDSASSVQQEQLRYPRPGQPRPLQSMQSGPSRKTSSVAPTMSDQDIESILDTPAPEITFYNEKNEVTEEAAACNDVWETLEQMNGTREKGYSKKRTVPTLQVPFESNENFFSGLFKTIKKILLTPAAFFIQMPQKGLGRPFLFLILMTVLGILTFEMHNFLGTDLLSVVSMVTNTPLPSHDTSLKGIGAVLLGSIIVTPLFLFLSAALIHLSLALLRANHGSFQGTVRMLAYTTATNVLFLVPVIGPVLFPFWILWVFIIGLKTTHATSYFRVLGSFPVCLCILVWGGYGIFSLLKMYFPEALVYLNLAIELANIQKSPLN